MRVAKDQMPSQSIMAVRSMGAVAAPADAAQTATEQALQLLRQDIVSGVLLPDTKLKMRELKERYGFGATPLREALSQLAAQGFVSQASQRGFRVPPLSLLHLDDISRSRQLIEGEALRLAIDAGGDAWEAEISASFYLLEQQVLRLQAKRQPLDDGYEQIHSRFHRALVAACPLPSLKIFSEQLYTQGIRYRLLMLRAIPASQEVIDEHRRLKGFTLARKSDAAIRALCDHIAFPARIFRQVLAGDLTSPETGARSGKQSPAPARTRRATASTRPTQQKTRRKT
jgi:GntR family transcriptional regulator, carbon starvation induced regulator